MTHSFRRHPQSAWRIFRWPLAIGVASVVGLVSALLGNGWYDAISWTALGFTIPLIAAAFLRGDT